MPSFFPCDEDTRARQFEAWDWNSQQRQRAEDYRREHQ